MMNNHATRLGLAGVDGSGWNSSCAQIAAVLDGWHRLGDRLSRRADQVALRGDIARI